jgi:hypothetical protein
MDPYTQAVVDVQKREAQRQADIQRQQATQASIGRGTFGGGRQALMQIRTRSCNTRLIK